jgi:hypothetical protein
MGLQLLTSHKFHFHRLEWTDGACHPFSRKLTRRRQKTLRIAIIMREEELVLMPAFLTRIDGSPSGQLAQRAGL